MPGSPCKTGPVYGPFFFFKFLGSITRLALSRYLTYVGVRFSPPVNPLVVNDMSLMEFFGDDSLPETHEHGGLLTP